MRLGPFEARYCLLFQEALARGPIGDAERARLHRAATGLGLEEDRVARLEAALRAGVAPGAGRSPRDTIVDTEDPGALTRSSGHMSIGVDSTGRTRAVSVTYEPMHETHDVATTRVSADLAWAHQEHELWHARYDACEREGRLDAQFCTAAVLVHGGVATPEEATFYEQHHVRSVPPRPRTALTAEAWSLLFHPAESRLTSEIFELIAPAALLCRVAAMQADRTLLPLDERARQDPEGSTLSAVRAVAWAATTLGLGVPPIYVAPEADAGLEIVTHLPPVSRIGARVLTGQSSVHLAFHAARHMSWFRGDHFVCTLVPTLADLADLFVAALSLGAPELVLHEGTRSRSRAIADAIGPLLEPPTLSRLRERVGRFITVGAPIDLHTWSQAVGDTAARAGALLCGDVEVACHVIAQEPDGAERVRDIERFFVSDAATELRTRMGIALS